MSPEDTKHLGEESTELVRRPTQLPALRRELPDYLVKKFGPDAPQPEIPEEPSQLVKFRRVLLGNAAIAYAALGQLQAQIFTAQNRLKLLRDVLETNPIAGPEEVAGHISELKRRIGELGDIVKFARQQLRSPNPPAVLPKLATMTTARGRLDNMGLEELMVIEKECIILAHDVDNMLSGALNSASLMPRTKPEKLKERLGTVEAALEQAHAELVETLTRKELHNLPLPKLEEEIQKVQRTLGDSLEMSVEVDPRFQGDHAFLMITPGTLRRLVFDLTQNAQKAGATRVKVAVGFANSNELEMRITDNGPGFGGKSIKVAAAESKSKSVDNGNGIMACIGFAKKAGGSLALASTTRDEARDVGAEWIIRLPLLKSPR